MAGNVLGGRDYDLTAEDVRAIESRTDHQIMVTLRELERGNVAVDARHPLRRHGHGSTTTASASTRKTRRRWRCASSTSTSAGKRTTRCASSGRAPTSPHTWSSGRRTARSGLIVLIEGGDSITSPDRLPVWFERGVRVIGPAWSATRYCGGTRREGPLTDIGRELVAGMKELGVILDVSHMAEESFWQALDVGYHRVVATHANVRAIVPEHRPERHLSDDMLAALGKADGVIGVVPANAFLDDSQWGVDRSGPPLTLDAVKKHLDHMAAIVGWDKRRHRLRSRRRVRRRGDAARARLGRRPREDRGHRSGRRARGGARRELAARAVRIPSVSSLLAEARDLFPDHQGPDLPPARGPLDHVHAHARSRRTRGARSSARPTTGTATRRTGKGCGRRSPG